VYFVNSGGEGDDKLKFELFFSKILANNEHAFFFDFFALEHRIDLDSVIVEKYAKDGYGFFFLSCLKKF